MRILGLSALSGIVLASVAFFSPDTNTFTETFDGNPSVPTAYTSNTVAVTRTERNLTGDTLQPQHFSMHGPDCGIPPAQHVNSGSREDSVFLCRDHVMTSISGTPYGAVYLTPTAMVDWSSGSAKVSWTMSTARSSARDWVALDITPWANALDVPAGPVVDNDLNGAPLNAIHIEMDLFTDRITPEIYIQGARLFYNELVIPYTDVVAPDNARRDLFELTITNSTLTLKLNDVIIMTGSGITAPFTSGMVQFSHHAYSPGKGCTTQAAIINTCVDGDDIASSNTWHWDNFNISPALPLGFIQANEDYSTGGTIHLPSVTKENSKLRFNAIGRVELSWDGVTYFDAPIQPGNQERDPFHVSNYWVDVPAGLSQFDVRFSLDGPYPSEMLHGKDFTVWNAASVVSTPTPVPTSIVSVTPTPTVTSTPTSSPTASPSATPTVTSSPVPTITVTPTPTPLPACRVQVRNLSDTGWTYATSRGSYTGTLVNGVCSP